MTSASTLRRLAPAAVALATLGLAAPAAHASDDLSPDVQEQLAAVKAANDTYRDPAAAVAAGYAATDECAASPEGVMGYHYTNPKLLGAPMDPLKPPILLYQPDGDGGRKLVAVEYLKPDADQDLATSDDKPTLFGRPFDGPMDGHAPGMPKHYDLHAWLWQDNPKGTLEPWNPAGSCAVEAAQVSAVPSGGAATGGGAGRDSDTLLLFGVAGVAIVAGAGVVVAGRRS